MKNIIAIIAGVFMASAVSAAEVDYIVGGETGRHYATVFGPIQVGDSVKLEALLLANPQITHVGLISEGGIADEGYRLAEVISNHSLDTVVPEGAWCLSACAEAFIGGVNYEIDGILGFHKSYIPPQTENEIGSQDAFDFGQQAGMRSLYAYLANGFSAQLGFIIGGWTSPENFLVFFSEEQLAEFFVRSDEDSVTDYLSSVVQVDEQWLDSRILNGTQMLRFLGYI